MAGGKQPAQTKPTALGAMVQASTYGQVIPVIYGRVRTPLYVIYGANLVKEASSGKIAKSNKKGGPPKYSMATDFLIGANPVPAVYATWFDQYGRIGTGFPGDDGAEDFDISTGQYEITITDPHFAGIVNAVVLRVDTDEIVEDYGATGSIHLQATNDRLLLYNAWHIGPNPTDPWMRQKWPYVYYWEPSMGPTIRFPANELADRFTNGVLQGHVTVYYEVENSYWQNGLAHYRLRYEPQLGDGGGSGQPITYPMYAGVGSPNIDCGAGAVIPGIKLEVQGKYSIWPVGDCDFVDIAADVLRSGLIQQSHESDDVFGLLQHGANCYEYPGIVESKYVNAIDPSGYHFTFNHPITEGTLLIVFMSAATGSLAPSIEDDAGNTWVQRYAANNPDGDLAYAVWYTFSNQWVAGNQVRVGLKPFNYQIFGYAVPGVDEFDVSGIGTNLTLDSPSDLSVETTNAGGQASWAMAFVQCSAPQFLSFGSSEATGWSVVGPPAYPDFQPLPQLSLVLKHDVSRYSGPLALRGVQAAADWVAIIITFKQSTPQDIAMPLGEIIDTDSWELTRDQCHANDLQGSLTMTSQKTASDWLKLLGQCSNAEFVWSGFKLKLIPRSEVSALRWGIVYRPPTADGPVLDLYAERGDMLSEPGQPAVSVERSSQTDAPNVFQATIFPRIPNYDQTNISEMSPGATLRYGTRKADPVTLDCVVDAGVGRKLLKIAARVATLNRNTYKFKLAAHAGLLLEPMDLVTITDELANIVELPVRLNSIKEDEDYTYDCEAEPFIYGMYAPNDITASTNEGFTPPFNEDPGSVNAPIIFQPVPRLLDNQSQAELWLVVSGSGQYYGGCIVMISTDGGSSYAQLGQIDGNATTGYLTGDWPASADPDTTNDLAVDLTESRGSLESYSETDEDNFVYPVYVEGGDGPLVFEVEGVAVASVDQLSINGTTVAGSLRTISVEGVEVAGSSDFAPSIPYELSSYADAELTDTYKYTLRATASGSPAVSHHLRRAVFGAPFVGEGVDHATGARFAWLDPSGHGMLKVDLDSRWIGQTLYFKLLAYNIMGNRLQSESDAVAYSYTPRTQGTSPSYNQSPSVALSQPVGMFEVDMVQVTEEFSANRANYNARTFAVPDPGGSPVTYYVTIYDPSYAGEAPGSPVLDSYCETTTDRVGISGYIYIGSIDVTHAGGATTVTPGGWPQ